MPAPDVFISCFCTSHPSDDNSETTVGLLLPRQRSSLNAVYKSEFAGCSKHLFGMPLDTKRKCQEIMEPEERRQFWYFLALLLTKCHSAKGLLARNAGHRRTDRGPGSKSRQDVWAGPNSAVN